MYFFYFDETGDRGPVPKNKQNIYVLTAIGLFERRWNAFSQEISEFKNKLRKRINQDRKSQLQLSDCEVKSHSLRHPVKEQKGGYNSFVHNLIEEEKRAMTDLYFSQLSKHHMRLFSVVVDKSKLRQGTAGETMHNKAYEYILERITRYLREYHRGHNGVIVMDDTQTQLNRIIANRHAHLQQHGNTNLSFDQIIEYPFFTDSKLSNGIQLADLCSYNVFRAFNRPDFDYSYFQKLIPFFYRSKKSSKSKLDGLKIWPDDSPLIGQWSEYLKKNPPSEDSGF